MDAGRVAAYERLMDAQERIAVARTRHGESAEAIERALSEAEADDAQSGSDQDLYLGTLARFVTALGGQLQLSAVFPEEAIELPSEPDRKHDAGTGSHQGPRPSA